MVAERGYQRKREECNRERVNSAAPEKEREKRKRERKRKRKQPPNTMSNADESPTLSIPSLAILALFAFLLYRYLLSSNTSSSTSPSSSLSAAEQRRTGLHFTPAQVEQVAQMFPQLGRREIMWDLQRNRGSVQATVERIMGGRGLDVVRFSLSSHCFWFRVWCVRLHCVVFAAVWEMRSAQIMSQYTAADQDKSRYFSG